MAEEALAVSAVDEDPGGHVSMDKEDEGAAGSPPEKPEGQEASGKDEKTTPEGQEAQEEVSDDKEVEEAIKKGASIPFERFKKWNEGKNTIKTQLETLKAENEEVAELLKNPAVFRAVLQSQGITDPKVLSQKMKEAGFETEEKSAESEEQLFTELSKGLDLTTQKGWFEMMKRMSSHFAQEAVRPIGEKLSQKDVQSYITEQEGEAKKIAKDSYGMEYGTSGKDEKNPNTAIGKMSAYLDKHPEDARLGHVKILRLALAEEGVKLGEKKGKDLEKKRNETLKASAFEDDAQVTKDETPQGDWPVSKILAWRRKYGK